MKLALALFAALFAGLGATPALAAATLDEAVATFRAGDVRAAHAQIAEVVRADPKPLAIAFQGRVLLALRDGQAAEATLGRAIDAGYGHDKLRHLLAHAYLLEGRTDAALEEARADRIPTRYAAYAARMRAAAQSQLGNGAAAAHELDLAGRLAPDDSHVWSDGARMRLFAGNVAGAQAAAARAIDLDAANVEALVLSGNLVRDQYGLEAALPWYDRALAVEPGNLAAMLERAATLGDLGRARDMLAQTRAVLAADPKNPQAFYLQAVLAARARDWGLARALLYRIGDRLGELPGARLLSALVELGTGNSEQAIAQLRVLIETQPGNVKARRLLGAALWQSGDDHGAVDVLRPIAERADADSYTLTVMGRANERLGNRSAAADYLDRASQPVRGAATPFDGGASMAAPAGPVAVPVIRTLLTRGRGPEATAEAQRLVAQNPGAPATLVLLGDTLGAQGRYRDAAEAYRRAANLRFSESTALRLIDARRRAGDTAGARQVLDLYRAQNPQSAATALIASDLSLADARWDEAAALLEGVRRRIGDRDATLLNNLGWARLGQGRATQAVALGKAAYALAPQSAPVAASYGWFALAAGDRATAVALLEKAVALAPAVPAYRERLAKARG